MPFSNFPHNKIVLLKPRPAKNAMEIHCALSDSFSPKMHKETQARDRLEYDDLGPPS